MSNKIGIGIITCNRIDFFKELILTVPDVDNIVIVNDGDPYPEQFYFNKPTEIIQHKKNKGIAKSKNDALTYLLDNNCEHIFLFEDDIKIVDPTIIENYINASKVSGILHFNYAYHGAWNKTSGGDPKPSKTVTYDNSLNICFFHNITGALSYFRDTALKKAGLMDETYKNVLEHVDHTYQIIKAGFHPPFRWFADVEESFYKIGELDPLLSQSVNSKNFFSVKARARIFGLYFMIKNGYRPHKIPSINEEELENYLDNLRQKTV